MQTQPNMKTTTADKDAAVSQLSSFCRGEMSAVETYDKAISLPELSTYRETLSQCRQSHEDRVRILSEEIRRLGGQVPTSSGAWGVFAKAVEGAAAAISGKVAVDVLEEGEDHGLRDYRSDITKLDASLQPLVRDRVMVQQIETHRAMSTLKKSFKR